MRRHRRRRFLATQQNKQARWRKPEPHLNQRPRLLGFALEIENHQIDSAQSKPERCVVVAGGHLHVGVGDQATQQRAQRIAARVPGKHQNDPGHGSGVGAVTRRCARLCGSPLRRRVDHASAFLRAQRPAGAGCGPDAGTLDAGLLRVCGEFCIAPGGSPCP